MLYYLIMNLNKITKIIPSIIAIIVVLVFFGGLVKNINYVKFPNSDFFQYIDDGYQYLNFKLPDSIHPPPFAPIIICLVSKLFSNIQIPELFSAHLINIICATLALLNIFLIFSKKRPWFGLLIILLIATNKIYITNSLNITNEVIFAFFFTLTLLLYSKKYYLSSYLLSGLSFFVRYEAIVVVMAIFAVDFFGKNKKIKLIHFLMAIIPIIFWLIILNFHSLGSSIFQNAYINEMVVGINDIPNIQPFNSLIGIVLSNPIDYLLHIVLFPNKPINFTLLIKYSRFIFSSTILIICLKNIFSKKNNNIDKIICLTIPFYLIFTSLFPNFSIRYLFPIFWIVYFVLINRKNRIITTLIFIILLTINLINIKQFSVYNESFEKSEYSLVSNWINQQKFKEKTSIIFYQPFAIEYFINQSQKQNILFDEFYSLANKCQHHAICVLKEIYQNQKTKRDILFITTSYTSTSEEQIDDIYLSQTTGMKMFNDRNLTFFDKKQLVFITELKVNNYHWARIYKYIPPKK